MLIGYAIIAVPTGIVSSEITKQRLSKNTPKCPNCSAEINSKDNFCPNCGNKIN